jgi:hypothetical protein
MNNKVSVLTDKIIQEDIWPVPFAKAKATFRALIEGAVFNKPIEQRKVLLQIDRIKGKDELNMYAWNCKEIFEGHGVIR